ncbi:MAG TPA: folylpolyglutamate synthase/dihydrofolate synthase family protein [Candidatus Obscuribacterales bacterium]
MLPTWNDDAINQRLEKYGRFGVHLGLERIQRLLAALDHPEKSVPVVHVAGSNGKGSVCAYVASALRAAGYRVGRYTSPHLVSWGERIWVDGAAIAPAALAAVLSQVEAAIAPDGEPPTQFEVFTAAAWLYFAQQAVDVAVIEVGLGGRLDATNVVDDPLVTVIVSLSLEHWQRLGPTLADIAREKAGILKPRRPAVIGPLPPEAEAVVLARAATLECPLVRPQPAQPIDSNRVRYRPSDPDQPELDYFLNLEGQHQLTNSAIAIATLYALRDQGWQLSDQAIQDGMAQAQWPGRLQWLTWHAPGGTTHRWLIDGAHNPAAAQVLRAYVDTLAPPAVTWLLGMLTTKDHADVLRALLRPGDRLHLVPVPDHSSMEPEALRAIALAVCPDLGACLTYPTLRAGLTVASQEEAPLRVLCGSLYLIGHFLGTETTSA